MLHQGKWNKASLYKDIKMYDCSGKLSHIARFCCKAKKNTQENAYNSRNDDGYSFAMQHRMHLETMCK